MTQGQADDTLNRVRGMLMELWAKSDGEKRAVIQQTLRDLDKVQDLVFGDAEENE